MSRLAMLAFAWLLGAALPACAKPPSDLPEPVAVHLGEDECAHCKMIVGDDRLAAEVVGRDGSAAIYDDLGCLLSREAAARPDPRRVFVRAFDGAGWLRAESAIVVRSGGISSPMGYGLAAFGTRDAAEAEARRHPDASIVPLATLLRDGVLPALPRPPIDSTPHVSQGEIQP